MAASGGRSFVVQQPIRLDLHNHTSFSSDGVMSPRDLLLAARANGVDCIAVTDHNTLDGALEAAALAEADPALPRVIPGIEISTADGDIIGLYLRETVPSGLPASDTVALIRQQGGVVYLPHPCDLIRRGTISARVRDRTAGQADVVEVLNGRALSPWSVRNSNRLASRHAKPRGAGSDAHGPNEVGRAYVLVDRHPTREDLPALVAQGSLREGLHWHEYLLNWALQPLSAMTRFRRKRGREAPRR
jgi:predicted metal-dependent phosphoesterase TrpH